MVVWKTLGVASGYVFVLVLIAVVGSNAGATATMLECDPGDLVYRSVREFPTTRRPGPPEPANALDDLLEESYPQLRAAMFARTQTRSRGAEFVYAPEGRPKFVVSVDTDGRTWAVESYAACNALLKAATEAARP